MYERMRACNAYSMNFTGRRAFAWDGDDHTMYFTIYFVIILYTLQGGACLRVGRGRPGV